MWKATHGRRKDSLFLLLGQFESLDYSHLGVHLLICLGIDIGCNWGCGENTYMQPFHVAAWLPYSIMTGFQK